MRSFGSDNHSGIHPRILEAIAAANLDHTFAYGNDPWSERVKGMFRGLFGEEVDTYLVFNGTGANILALRTLTRPYNGVICAQSAHINVDECGAPEFHTGCKLLPIETSDGKLTPELVKTRLTGFGFQHHSQPGMISISQPTELGTLYSVQEIRALAELAHAEGLYLHVDGARFANAVAALGCSAHEMITRSGVDVLSFGGTKNGMMLGEAVIFLNRELSKNAIYERKQLMQLASKMRFVAAQFEAYLQDDLWLELARASNRSARYLGSLVEQIPQIRLTQRVEVNGVFALLPPNVSEQLRKAYFFYDWNEARGEVRWMCSFDTSRMDVDRFVEMLKLSIASCQEIDLKV